MKRPFSFFPAKDATRSVWAHWLFTYLTLLAIPMVLSWTIYTQALRALDQQMKYLTYASLKQTQIAIDSELQKAAALAGQYLTDRRVQAALFTEPDDPMTMSVWHTAVQAMGEVIIHPIVSNIGVYLPQHDRMLTNNGSCSLDTYARAYIENRPAQTVADLSTNTDVDALRQLLSGRHTGRFVKVEDAVLYLYSSPTHGKKGSVGTLSLLLNTEHIARLLDQADWITTGRISVSEPSGVAVASIENGNVDSTAYVQEFTSPKTGFIYALATPHAAYDTSVQSAMHASIVGFILSLLLGLGAAFYFTHRMGKPIVRIFNKLNDSAGRDLPIQKQSIYQAMDGAINALVAAKRGQLEENDRDLQAYRERMLLSVLEGYRCSQGFLCDLCDVFALPKENCAYIIACLCGVSQPFVLPEAIHGICLPDEQGITLIAFAEEGEYAAHDAFQHAVFTVIQETVQACAQASAAIGPILSDMDSLPGAGAKIAQAARDASNGEVQIVCHLLSSDNASFAHEFPPREIVEHIVLLVRSRDLRTAAHAICDYIEHEEGTDEASAGWNAAIMAGIALKEMQAWMDRSSLAQENVLPQLFLCNSRKEACAQVSRFMIRMEEGLADGHDMDIAMRAIAYIEREYADMNLSLEAIARALGVSASSLTRKFKANVGMTVLAFIHATRVARAKEMLALTMDERPSIGEIAQRVGFQNANTFIRIFKRYTGTTPGQF